MAQNSLSKESAHYKKANLIQNTRGEGGMGEEKKEGIENENWFKNQDII